MRMKNVLAAAALTMVVAQPVAASAATTSSASKLSLRNAVPADARASTTAGKNKALGAGVILLIVAGVVGVVAIAASGGSDSN